jgi:hypothetical protein
VSKSSNASESKKSRSKSPTQAAAGKSTSSARKEPPVESKRRGRPRGKRSDPDFDQTTAYIRKDTYKAVRIALLEEGEGREYSELVEEVLSDWLKKRK